MDEQHLTIEELAKRLRVPVKTIYNWNHLGTGPKRMQFGRTVRYKLSDVVAWESQHYAEAR
ncbi:helix-turn-helix transcriptional regulator [Nonomuraea sp. NPDC049028]|uniref:helix-turn-helix transcriptional regulator n=1 Tax=Nonomuraea sp. NPDC049028 TaxID=3364348 RepID=UPI00371FC2C5